VETLQTASSSQAIQKELYYGTKSCERLESLIVLQLGVFSSLRGRASGAVNDDTDNGSKTDTSQHRAHDNQHQLPRMQADDRGWSAWSGRCTGSHTYWIRGNWCRHGSRIGLVRALLVRAAVSHAIVLDTSRVKSHY
jgi:hypothetical protein